MLLSVFAIYLAYSAGKALDGGEKGLALRLSLYVLIVIAVLIK